MTKGREHRRRMKVLRGAVPLLVIGLLLCAMAVRLRNAGRIAKATADFEADIAGLIQSFEKTGTLPMFFPPRGPDDLPSDTSRFTYIDSAMVQHLRDTQEPLIVAYSNRVRQILGADARVVAVRQDGQIQISSVPAPEFREVRAAQEARANQAIQAARQGHHTPP